MKLNTASFFDFSDVFEGNPRAASVFTEGDPDCSFGNNNRTLVTAQTIIDTLDGFDAEEDDKEDAATEEEIAVVMQRLKSIPEGIYVDLEN